MANHCPERTVSGIICVYVSHTHCNLDILNIFVFFGLISYNSSLILKYYQKNCFIILLVFSQEDRYFPGDRIGMGS